MVRMPGLEKPMVEALEQAMVSVRTFGCQRQSAASGKCIRASKHRGHCKTIDAFTSINEVSVERLAAVKDVPCDLR